MPCCNSGAYSSRPSFLNSGALRRLIALISALMLPLSAQAGLIRDAEIEHTLSVYAAPILQAADIPPDSVRIFIIGSPEVNAFVAGGLNIFLHTGLIRETKTPGMLIGVIAHETGHIAGAHLSQLREKASRASIGNIIGVILGAAAAAGGGGQVGAGILSGSQNIAGRSFLTTIRQNEQAADQAAINFLEANNISATGMLDMFEVLRRRESGLGIRDKYLLSHPLSSERIAAIRNHLQESTTPPDQIPDAFNAMHARMLAKLFAFTETYDTTLQRYPTSDMSVAARYARAIAEYKRSRFAQALSGINSLIAEYPKDPYFYDTKGQILFENGKVQEAAAAYAKASSLAPDSALILTEQAKSLIALNQRKPLDVAIPLLERAIELDDSNAATWRQLAIAFGQQGKLGRSYEALAEESLLSGDYESVLQHVARARRDATDDSALSLQLDDLERAAKAQREKQKDADSLF